MRVSPIRSFLAHPVIAGVLAAIIGAGVLALLSRVSTGTFTGLLPAWGWALALLIVLLIAVVVVATNRYLVGRAEQQGPLVLLSRPRIDYMTPTAVYEDLFLGVVWRYRGAVVGESQSQSQGGPDIGPDTIEVEVPPLCPRCQTGLQQTTGVFGRRIWSCVACKWRKRSRESIYTAADQATLFFQGAWRRKLRARGMRL